MFVGTLTPGEQSVYCQLAYVMMAADGETVAKELAFYDRSMRDLGLDQLPEVPDGDVIAFPDDAFRLPATRKALLLELSLLAVADGRVTPEERTVLTSVASEFGVDGREVERCLEYARRLQTLLDEGFEMLAEVD